MKDSPSKKKSRKGFTLVELLVVISIIAILTGLISSAVTKSLNRSKMLETKNTAIQIVQAIESYYHEYGYLPPCEIGGSGYSQDSKYDTTKSDLISILAGEDKKKNRKEIIFYRGKQANRKGGSGLEFSNSSKIVKLRDSWGNGFLVAMDTNYDEKIYSPHNILLRGKRAIVWTNGKDKQINLTKAHKCNRDNVYSW